MLNRIKNFFSTLKHEPEAAFEIRQLFFGLIIAIGVTYGLYYVLVESKEKKQMKLAGQYQQLKQSLGNGSMEKLIALELEKKQKKQQQLVDRMSLLQFKRKLLREQYITSNPDHIFSKVIFTLLPRTPVNIEQEFVQMSVLETRSLEYYKIHPVNIQGEAGFAEIMSYLKYIESRPEVGWIDSLKLEQIELQNIEGNVKVHFDVVLGRIQLND